jgi:hypothetical protein
LAPAAVSGTLSGRGQIRAKLLFIMKRAPQYECKIRDQVVRLGTKKPLRGIVVEVGKLNQHNHPLDCMVKWADGSTEQVSPMAENVIILAPNSEVPQLRPYLEKHKLILARKPASGEWMYRLLKQSDFSELFVEIVEHSTTELRLIINRGKLVALEGKPNLEDSETYLRAGHKRIPRAEFEEVAEWQNYF